MAEPFNVGDSDFETLVLGAAAPVLVDFWAPWCAPCRMIAPVLDELAEEYSGRVGFARLNVDENPRVAASYGINSIPTLLIFKDGKTLEGIVGFRPKAELKERLDVLLGK